jgi:hypothetical protein
MLKANYRFQITLAIDKTLSLIIYICNVTPFSFFSICYACYTCPSPGNDIYSLAQIKDGVKSKRMSSNDTSGNNNDRLENIRRGEKK